MPRPQNLFFTLSGPLFGAVVSQVPSERSENRNRPCNFLLSREGCKEADSCWGRTRKLEKVCVLVCIKR